MKKVIIKNLLVAVCLIMSVGAWAQSFVQISNEIWPVNGSCVPPSISYSGNLTMQVKLINSSAVTCATYPSGYWVLEKSTTSSSSGFSQVTGTLVNYFSTTPPAYYDPYNLAGKVLPEYGTGWYRVRVRFTNAGSNCTLPSTGYAEGYSTVKQYTSLYYEPTNVAFTVDGNAVSTSSATYSTAFSCSNLTLNISATGTNAPGLQMKVDAQKVGGSLYTSNWIAYTANYTGLKSIIGAANLGGDFNITVSFKSSCNTNIASTVRYVKISTAPTGNFQVGYYNGTNVWVSHGTAGNLCGSPITTCNSQLVLGGGTGSSYGAITGVKLKLEKLTGGTYTSPVYSTVFDGTTSSYPIWNYNGTINSWATLNVPVQSYCQGVDPTNALVTAFFNQYILGAAGTQFRLTANIYHSCTTTPLVQTAYITKNVGCKKDDSNESEFIESVKNMIENTANTNTDFQLSPNPSANNVIVTFNNSYNKDAVITVIDIQGKKISLPTIQLSTNQIQMDVSSLQKGIYFVQADNNNITTKKLVIE